MKSYFRCVCCGAVFYTDKPQNPNLDTGRGVGNECRERLARSYERDGFASWQSMPRAESEAMFNRYA